MFFKSLFNSNPNKKATKQFFASALLHASQGDYAKAIELYSKAIDAGGANNYSNVFYNRANAKASCGDNRGAIEDYSTSIKLNDTGNGFDAYYNRANSKLSINDIEGAVEDFTQVIKVNPKFGPAFTSRARVYAQLGKHHLSMNDYLKAIEIDDNALRYETCLGLADAYYNLKDYPNAKSWYEFALAYNRSSQEATIKLEELGKKK